MKKVLAILAIAGFVACNSGENKPAATDTATTKVDTAAKAADTTKKVDTAMKAAVDTTKK